MPSTQVQRIEANCRIIWGNGSEYELDIETDDYVNYSCYVRRDFGTSFGPALMIAIAHGSSERALAELDRMLGLWVKYIERGTPMSKDERLEIFGGPRGKYKNLLSEVIDVYEKIEGAKQA